MRSITNVEVCPMLNVEAGVKYGAVASEPRTVGVR